MAGNQLSFDGASIGAVNVESAVKGNQVGTLHNYPQKQNLIEAASEIQKLLDYFSQTYPTTTETEKK